MLLLQLICFHYLFDFAIQGDFVAKFKARYIDGNHNPIWFHVLTAHSAAHTLPVLFLTGSVGLGLFMFASHFLIDYAKCAKELSFNQDQLLHLVVVLIISYLA